MRTIKELLTIMLEHRDLFSKGLCNLASMLIIEEYINYKEFEILLEYIDNNKPDKYSSFWTFIYSFKNNDYYWPKGMWGPRAKWIKKHIKLNTDESDN